MARGATDLSTQDKVSGSLWTPFSCRLGSLMWRLILIFSSWIQSDQYEVGKELIGGNLYDFDRYDGL